MRTTNRFKNTATALLVIGVFLLSLSPVLAQKPDEKEILESFPHHERVVYKTVKGTELDLVIFYPTADKMQTKNPWMLYVHGGGWAGGSPFNIFGKPFLGTLRSLVDKGVICATVEYRLAKNGSTAYESAVDAKDAARFLLKNAKKYKLDDNKYGAWGGSAGGHLSLITALGADADFKGETKLLDEKPKFKCVVSYFPFTSCLNPDIRPNSIFADGTLFVRLLGAPLEEKPELAKLLSPTELLTEKSPPILLLHGDNDKVLPISNSIYMMEVAKQKKANVELLTIKNAGHSFSGKNISPSIEELNDYAANFILKHLK
ncbi:prolyl oligopeptidase family serine peptidase [Flavobacterium sp. UMI-01]|uniref:prolyl oligopeptidase family serine peptidase n=1 Tax=Flavobacterium sp. UMI-01 TaxID=1441053 RepID=UPI001C7D8D73|nr:prolyl oligopeptidase family serine peptidase [Flavobacterium sp. UMI-01]